MAREHARMKLSIWEDDDFRALSPAAQHLYMVLMIHPKLDYAGVADWRPGRLAQFSAGWTGEVVEIAAQELSTALFIVVDTESEEVLLRSFIRNDELLESPNMAVAVRKAHMAIASSALRAIVVHELNRLRKDKPDLKGWPKVLDLLDRPSLDPSDYPSFTPSVDPSASPSAKGHPIPSLNGSVGPSPTTAPASNSSSSYSYEKNKDQLLTQEVGNRSETPPVRDATKHPPEPPPGTRPTPRVVDESRCSKHPDGNLTNDPCAGCARVREYRDKAADRDAEKRRRELEDARNHCDRCDGTWLTDDNGRPTRRKCDHQRRTA